MWTMNFQMFKLDLEKAEELEIKWPTFVGPRESKRIQEKHLPLLYWLHQRVDCVGHNKLWKILKWWEYQTTLPASWETCVQVKKQQLELDMEQQTVSKVGKEYVKTVYSHPDYLTYMQSTSSEMLDWMKHNLKSRLSGEISIALALALALVTIVSDMLMTPPLWQKANRNWRDSWWKWKRRVKSWLKTQHSQN